MSKTVTFQPGDRTSVVVPGWFPKAFEGLPARIVKARQERNVSQRQMCADLGFSRPQLSRYENGHVTPSLIVLVSIAFYLDVPLERLVYGG